MEGAARCFLKAKQYQPNTEESAFLEILAHKLLGDISLAFRIASEAKTRYGESAKILSAWLQTAPLEMSFADLSAGIPLHQRTEPDVAIGMAIVAGERGLISEATAHAKIAAEKSVNFVDAKVLWASLVIEPFARGDLWPVDGAADQTKIADACAALRDSIETIRHGGNNDYQAKLYLKLSIGQILLGREQDANDAISNAFKLSPSNDEIRRQFAFSRFRNGKLNDAIAILDRNVESSAPRTQLTWSQMKAQRGNPGDLQAALDILKRNIGYLTDLPEGVCGSWVETMVKLHIGTNDATGALKLLEDASFQKHLSVGRRLILLGTAEFAIGNNAKACANARDALIQLDTNDPDENEDLASLFEKLGEMDSALEIWKRATSARSPIRQLRHVMILAAKQEDEAYILKLGESLRARGIHEVSLIEFELAALERSSLNRTEEFIRDMLAIIAEGRLKRYLRMRQTHLGARMKRPDLIERDVSLLPTVDEIDEYLCEPAVIAIKHADATRAVGMAYELVRRFPDSEQAYRAMIASFFGRSLNTPEPSVPNVGGAGAGTAVLLTNLQDKTQHWYLIEESRELKPSLNETSKDSAIARAVGGRVVGDEVDVAEAFGAVHRVRIDQILHKWVFRYLQCLEQLPIKFPDQQMLKIFTIKENLPPQEGLREFLEFLERMHNRSADLFALFRNNSAMPLHLLARGLGKPLFPTMAQVAATKNTYLRCCTGTPHELANAEIALSAAKAIVLEPTAIGTMFLLDTYFDIAIYQDIEKWPWKCVISERTLELLHDYLDDVSKVGERLGTERIAGRILPTVASAEEIAQISLRLRPVVERLIKCVENHCEIVQGSTLPNIPSHLRDGFKAFGRAGTESLQIAKARDAVLWTDDMVISQMASREVGCRSAWTQIVCQIGVCQNNPDVFRRVSIALLSLKYDATHFTFEDAVWAAELAHWNVNVSPFTAVVECFARPTIPPEPLLGLAATLLKSVWSSPVYGLQATEFTQRLLDRLGSRASGRDLIQQLERGIDGLFGLHVIAGANVQRMIKNWLSARGEGGIIVP